MRYDDHGIPIIGPEPHDPDAEKRSEREAQRSYENKQTSLQSRILVTQVALVIFGLAGAAVSLWQARTAQDSADISDKSVLLAQRTERDSERAGGLQRKFAEDALHATIDEFKQDQRSWVQFSGLNKSEKQEGILRNTGKTPARNVVLVVGVNVTDVAYTFDTKDSAWMDRYIAWRLRHPKIPAGATVTSKIERTPTNETFIYVPELYPPNRDWRRINVLPVLPLGVIGPGDETSTIAIGSPVGGEPSFRAKGKIVVFGRITYEDIFRRHRTTTFCVERPLSSTGQFGICPVHNDMS